MRITIVNSHPKYLIGGAELFMYYVARACIRAGHEVHMVSVYPRGVPHPSFTSECTMEDGIHVHHLADVATDLKSAWRFLRLLGKIPTDVYLKMFTEPSTILLAMHALWKRIPYVLFMSHDSHCLKDAGLSVAARYRVSLWTRVFLVHVGLYAWSLRHADRLLVQNETQQRLLFQNFGIRADDMIKIGHPVPSDTGVRMNPPIAIWNARFQPWKRPEKFLDLAERLPQHMFVLGGPSPDDDGLAYTQEILARAARLPNVRIFLFPNTFEAFQTFPLYEQASVFIDTVERGGFENTLVQAWLRGVPVVSLSRHLDGVLEREEIGVCAHGDEDRCVALVEQLLTETSRRHAMGERARQFARREYDIEPIATRIVWHLRQAMERAPRAPFQGDSDLPLSM